MTDQEKLIELLDSWSVAHKILPRWHPDYEGPDPGDVTLIIHAHGSDALGKDIGYFMFESVFCFDAGGKYLGTGAWE